MSDSPTISSASHIHPDVVLEHNTSSSAAQLEETMQFFSFSHSPTTSQFKGTVTFKITLDDNTEVVRSIRVHPETGVQIYDGFPEDGQVNCECSCSSETFFGIYMNKIDARAAVISGRVVVKGFAFRTLSSFASAFDMSSARWDAFYEYQKQEQERTKKSLTTSLPAVSAPMLGSSERPMTPAAIEEILGAFTTAISAASAAAASELSHSVSSSVGILYDDFTASNPAVGEFCNSIRDVTSFFHSSFQESLGELIDEAAQRHPELANAIKDLKDIKDVNLRDYIPILPPTLSSQSYGENIDTFTAITDATVSAVGRVGELTSDLVDVTEVSRGINDVVEVASFAIDAASTVASSFSENFSNFNTKATQRFGDHFEAPSSFSDFLSLPSEESVLLHGVEYDEQTEKAGQWPRHNHALIEQHTSLNSSLLTTEDDFHDLDVESLIQRRVSLYSFFSHLSSTTKALSSSVTAPIPATESVPSYSSYFNSVLSTPNFDGVRVSIANSTTSVDRPGGMGSMAFYDAVAALTDAPVDAEMLSHFEATWGSFLLSSSTSSASSSPAFIDNTEVNRSISRLTSRLYDHDHEHALHFTPVDPQQPDPEQQRQIYAQMDFDALRTRRERKQKKDFIRHLNAIPLPSFNVFDDADGDPASIGHKHDGAPRKTRVFSRLHNTRHGVHHGGSFWDQVKALSSHTSSFFSSKQENSLVSPSAHTSTRSPGYAFNSNAMDSHAVFDILPTPTAEVVRDNSTDLTLDMAILAPVSFARLGVQPRKIIDDISGLPIPTTHSFALSLAEGLDTFGTHEIPRLAPFLHSLGEFTPAFAVAKRSFIQKAKQFLFSKTQVSEQKDKEWTLLSPSFVQYEKYNQNA